MVYNMAKFVDWPAESFPATGAPLTICVLGKGPLAAALRSLQGKTVRGRTLMVRPVSRVGETGTCQILVVTASERHQLPPLSPHGPGGLLTISDLDGFAHTGGVVGFVTENGKIRFEVNLDAAHRCRVRISSQLLKLARIVGRDE